MDGIRTRLPIYIVPTNDKIGVLTAELKKLNRTERRIHHWGNSLLFFFFSLGAWDCYWIAIWWSSSFSSEHSFILNLGVPIAGGLVTTAFLNFSFVWPYTEERMDYLYPKMESIRNEIRAEQRHLMNH